MALMIKTILTQLILMVSLFANIQVVNDKGFIDNITINSIEFESLEQQTIEFYPEDLEDGKVVIKGLLKVEDKSLTIDELFVEISIDNGYTWNKAIGHENWEFSFEPQMGYTYKFSLRITQDIEIIKNQINIPTKSIEPTPTLTSTPILPAKFKFAGFNLIPDNTVQVLDGKLTGTGTIIVPYFENFSLSNELRVSFEQLSFENEMIINGDITYSTPIHIQNSIATIDISKIVFSTIEQNNFIEGTVQFTNFLNFLPSFPISNHSKLMPDSFNLNIPIIKQNIDILVKQKVVLVLNTGFINISYQINNQDLNLDLTALNADVKFGDFLTNEEKLVNTITANIDFKNNETNIFNLTFQNDAQVYLLGGNFALENINANLNIKDKSIHIQSDTNLESYNNSIIKTLSGTSVSIDISDSQFVGQMTANSDIKDIVILKRENGKDVKLNFTSTPEVSLKIINNEIIFGINSIEAQLDFGDLLENSIVQLTSNYDKELEGIYTWSIIGSKKLIDKSKVNLSNIHGRLNLNDLSNPKIIFDSIINLSTYGGALTSISSNEIKNLTISKDGFRANLNAQIGDVDIWKDKGIFLKFVSNPTINIAVNKDEIDLSFSNINANLHLGELLDNAVAAVDENLMWNINSKKKLANSKIYLNNLTGLVDLSNLTNPSIILNTIATLNQYSDVFKNINNINIENATISKAGFESTFTTQLDAINIWEDKNIKIIFDNTHLPKFNINVDNEELHVGIDDFSATMHLGDFLNNATATIINLNENIYGWELSGNHTVQSTNLILNNLAGLIDFSDLKNPLIYLDSKVDLSKYGKQFRNLTAVTMENAAISKNGFKAQLNISLHDIDIWKNKNIKIDFNNDELTTINILMTRNNFNIGISDFNANIHFGDLLDGEIVKLTPLVNKVQNTENGVKQYIEIIQDATKCTAHFTSNIKHTKEDNIYIWSLQNSHELIEDKNGKVIVSQICGIIDLNNLLDPVIVFNAEANFTEYDFGIISIDDVSVNEATISKDGISWNIDLQSANTEFTILNLDTGNEEENVRIKLFNIDANGDSQLNDDVNSVDGVLYLGNLFNEHLEPINLHYDNSDLYSFSTNQIFTYTKNGNTIELSGINGTVQKIEDDYEITLKGQSQIQHTLLSQLGIEKLAFNNLTINNSGFTGNIITSWENKTFNLITNKASLVLNSIGININSTFDTPIRLTQIDGYLDLGNIFDETGKQARAPLSFINYNIAWNFENILHINDKFIFNGLNGTVNLNTPSSSSIKINGRFNYKGIDEIDVELNNFSINRFGINGEINLNNTTIPISSIDGLNLTSLNISFGSDISGNIALNFHQDAFLDALIDLTGIKEFTINTNTHNTISFSNITPFTTWEELKISLDSINTKVDKNIQQPTIYKRNIYENHLLLQWNHITDSNLSHYNIYVQIGKIFIKLNKEPIIKNIYRYNIPLNTKGTKTIVVTAVDKSGNESLKTKNIVVNVLDISAPKINKIDYRKIDNYLEISLDISDEDYEGFEVYRGDRNSSKYYNVSGFINETSYTDKSILKEKTYWYQIKVYDKTGNINTSKIQQIN